ncbi:conserved hypothetical protein [Pseudomonas protegens Pf-5]|uniref:Uncharacterized protein n=1 Tax=Pseudomonas fluorescens (strain ATCC BAA-477 / NRRL B-23932 / Pf-5) TaxID=220664 RepID=Q4KCN1_PSEF5|nr:conserved hypothetical protein [Pseudomonas protegens Pf-5]
MARTGRQCAPWESGLGGDVLVGHRGAVALAIVLQTLKYIDGFLVLGDQVVGVLVALEVVVLDVIELHGEILEGIERLIGVLRNPETVELIARVDQVQRRDIGNQAIVLEKGTHAAQGLGGDVGRIETLDLLVQLQLIHLADVEHGRVLAYQAEHLPYLGALGNRLGRAARAFLHQQPSLAGPSADVSDCHAVTPVVRPSNHLFQHHETSDKVPEQGCKPC